MAVVSTETAQQTTDDEWDEHRLEAALLELKTMHIKMRALRSAIPEIVKPLTSPHDSPESFYREFSSAATCAAKDVKAFITYMKSDESREILLRASSSREGASSDINLWKPTEHPDWLVEESVTIREERPKPRIIDDLEDLEQSKDTRDTISTVEAFRSLHPDVRIDYDAESRTITVKLPAPARMMYKITQKASGPGQLSYQGICEGKSKLCAEITKKLASRPLQGSLDYLLELINSYRDVKIRKCITCGELLDSTPQYAIIRKRRAIKTSENIPQITWEAYHETCV